MLKLAGFKPLVAGAKPKAQPAPVPVPAPVMEETKEFDVDAALSLIRKQNAIIAEQNAKLKAMTSAVSALMGMVTRLKAEKPQAEAPQKEESSTMAQLKKRFGL